MVQHASQMSWRDGLKAVAIDRLGVVPSNLECDGANHLGGFRSPEILAGTTEAMQQRGRVKSDRRFFRLHTSLPAPFLLALFLYFYFIFRRVAFVKPMLIGSLSLSFPSCT